MGAVSKPVLILLIGPTAVGKTEISIQLAERLNAEIISADSRLFYRGMDIGTAKPTLAQRSRVPHHLIDIVNPDETLSLVAFQALAREAISEIRSRGRLPMLVGGTGQYVRAVTAGWQPPRVSPVEKLRVQLQVISQERGGAWLHEKLQSLDPVAAQRIDVRNVRRTIRALEVILTSGRRFSDQRQSGDPSFRLIEIGLKRLRPDLYQRIDTRIERMFESGFIQEVTGLLARGYKSSLPAMTAIGYSQCVRLIEGQVGLEQTKADIRRATRAFVRRQSNWFKESDPAISWFSAAEPGITETLVSFVHSAGIP